MAFRCSLLRETAQVPKRGRPDDAGMDLFAAEDKLVLARSQAMIDTGVAFEMPSDCYGRVAPRSGLAAKNCMNVHAGVVDCTYRDSIRVILFNHSDADYQVKVGDRIAQIVFEKIYTPPELDVVPYEELTATVRGTGGFGSSGK